MTFKLPLIEIYFTMSKMPLGNSHKTEKYITILLIIFLETVVIL